MMAGMIYQTFVLDESKQKRVDVLRSKTRPQESIDSGRGKRLINLLKAKQYIVFVSNSTYSGVHEIIMVGAEFNGAGNIKTDFGKIAEELELHFMSGAFFTEA